MNELERRKQFEAEKQKDATLQPSRQVANGEKVTLTFADGRKYVGEVKNGKLDGQGSLTYADGRKYIGEFKDDKYNGQGTLTWTDGTKYRGGFKDGNRDGRGEEYRANGSLQRSANWENGLLVVGAPTSAQISSQSHSNGQDQSHEQIQIRKANELWDAKKYSELLKLGESWALANSDSHSAWYYLGLAYYGLGAKAKALPAFKEALRIKPDLPETIARILTMRGEKSRIEEMYAVLMQIDPVKAGTFKATFLARP